MAKTPDGPALFWFRDDLRLSDNPGLVAAAAKGRPLALLYVLEDGRDGTRPLGSAARWWLHHSLTSLARDIAKRGGQLIIRKGRASRILPEVASAVGASTVHWNRRYGLPAGLDDKIERSLQRKGIAVETHKASLLFEPDEIRNKSGAPFQVYSAFWRAALRHGDPRPPIATPKSFTSAGDIASEAIESLDLLPTAPNWATGISAVWSPGERSAQGRLQTFVENGLAHYAAERDEPGIDGSSMLSPYLRFGEISPFHVWNAVGGKGGGAAKFMSELGWREFAYHVLAEYPTMATDNLRDSFDAFPWEEPYAGDIWAWRRGRTGYPIVDAGMRQLWQTGWMHNRVRMIVASFLTKHLLIDWRLGEEWFWDTLVDADPANNPFNWQWVAGSGMDAQPYFRIFNPVLQGEKFDPKGAYLRKWVPELAALPDRFIHRPWKTSPLELEAAGIVLGKTYPEPLVEHSPARERALVAFKEMRQEIEARSDALSRETSA
jgi:deoxyribodipyrimidine photo-lyase